MLLYKNNRGFTLVELSIVIVIISLIVAGVSAGSNLVKQAQLRNIITDLNKYKSAVSTFRTAYNALPGDMINATSYWPSDITSNGDGNRKIYSNTLNNDTESMRVWEHLSLAGIIKSNYTGDGTITINTNIPAAPRNKGVYVFVTHSQAIFGRFGNILSAASLYNTNMPWGSIVSAQEAKDIDNKIDDGLAGRGQLRTARGDDFASNGNCVDNIYLASNANYILSDKEVHCRLLYFID